MNSTKVIQTKSLMITYLTDKQMYLYRKQEWHQEQMQI